MSWSSSSGAVGPPQPRLPPGRFESRANRDRRVRSLLLAAPGNPVIDFFLGRSRNSGEHVAAVGSDMEWPAPNGKPKWRNW